MTKKKFLKGVAMKCSMSCIDNFPNELAPNYECASELVALGPVAALLTLVIGIPVIKLILRYLKRVFDKYDYL